MRSSIAGEIRLYGCIFDLRLGFDHRRLLIEDLRLVPAVRRKVKMNDVGIAIRRRRFFGARIGRTPPKRSWPVLVSPAA
jgi:hypothetical protein